MRVSLCKHSFPLQPPHGSFLRPGDCTGCGATWDTVQAELQRQEQALILGTSRNGQCPDCARNRRLFRYQADSMPWHSPDHEQPVGFLCMDCWNATAAAEQAFNDAAFNFAGGTR